MDDAEKKEYMENENCFIGILEDWCSRNEGVELTFFGQPDNLLDKTILDLIKKQEEKEEQKAPGGRTKLETYLQEITEASALTRELAALFIQDVQIGERDGKTGAQEIKIDWLI